MRVLAQRLKIAADIKREA